MLPGLGVFVGLGGLGVGLGLSVGLGFSVDVGLVGLGVWVGFGVLPVTVGVSESVGVGEIGVTDTGVGVEVSVGPLKGVTVCVMPGVLVRREKLVGPGLTVDVIVMEARAAAVRVALNCSVARPGVTLTKGEDVGVTVGVGVEWGTTFGTNWQASGWRPAPASTTSGPSKAM